MRQGRWRLAKLSRQGTERGTALVVQPLRVVLWHLPIQGSSQRARLHRPNPHDAYAALVGRRDDLPRPGWLVIALHGPRGIEQIGHDLDSSGRRVLVERRDDRRRDPDAGNAPGPDAATGDELLQSRTHRLDKEAVGCPRGLVGARIRDDLIVHEEEVHPLELHTGQTLVETPLQQGQDLAGRPVADGTLGRYAYAWRQSAPKGLAEDHLGFATTIAGCHIETGDACLPGRTHGRHRLLAGGGTPDLTNAATAEGGDFCTTPRTGALGGVGEFRREQDLS